MMRRARFSEMLTATALAALLVGSGLGLAAPPAGKGGSGKVSLALSIQPTSVLEGAEATATVTHNNPDVTADVDVLLSSSDTGEATVPEAVTIPAGSNSITFSIIALNDSAPDGDQTVTITTAATNYQAGSASLTVVDVAHLPPIEYRATRIAPPYPSSTSSLHLNDFNDSGMAVGYYVTPDSQRRAWLYDPALRQAIDLNDVVAYAPDWVISSAVGVSNTDLVVGYVSLADDASVRRGYVLDLASLRIYDLPDQEWDWIDTYARKVNDNGDILGTFTGLDGMQRAYLYNPGLISPDLAFEIFPIDEITQGDTALSNPPPGFPATIVCGTPSGPTFRYTTGDDEVTFLSFGGLSDFRGATIDWFGGVAASGIQSEQIKKNQRVTTYYLYRELESAGAELVEASDSFLCRSMNDAGTVLIDGNGFDQIYHDLYGFVETTSLVSKNDRDLVWVSDYGSQIEFNGRHFMNSTGVGGFGQIAGATYDSEIIILTPHLIER